MFLAWIGTGRCEPTEVAISKFFQYAIVVGVLIGTVRLIKLAINEPNLIKKIGTILLIPVLLVFGLVFIFAAGIMAACSGWSGFF